MEVLSSKSTPGGKARPKTVGAGGERSQLAQAAILAIEPVVELLLEIGITSPEAESLVRSVFVHKAKEGLVKRGANPNRCDARIALITGVHRNFVRTILSEAPRIARGRERRRYLAGRLLHAWHTDAAYLNDSGKPRDLFERGPAPSFETLVAKSLPGASAGVVLQELLRAGVIESLAEHRVRVRSRTLRQPGLNLDNLLNYGREARAVLTTLTRKLYDPQASAYSDCTRAVRIDERRIPLMRDVIRRRAESFLSGIERELSAEEKGTRRHSSVALAVSVVESFNAPRARGGKQRERSQ